eukprot:SAG11_NODE_11157_length_780_cov_0.997063_1_plen_236_part_10
MRTTSSLSMAQQAAIDGRRHPYDVETSRLDELSEQLSAIRDKIADERRQRITLQDRVEVCQRQAEEERETRLALEREMRAGIEAAKHAQRADVANLEKTSRELKDLRDLHTELESEFSDQQSSMHMMMDMLEGAVDGKEARELVSTCDEKIGAVKTELQEMLDRMAQDLTDHLDQRLAEALQIGATAIEAIETLEQKMHATDATMQDSIKRQADTFDAEISEMADALETRVIELGE